MATTVGCSEEVILARLGEAHGEAIFTPLPALRRTVLLRTHTVCKAVVPQKPSKLKTLERLGTVKGRTEYTLHFTDARGQSRFLDSFLYRQICCTVPTLSYLYSLLFNYQRSHMESRRWRVSRRSSFSRLLTVAVTEPTFLPTDPRTIDDPARCCATHSQAYPCSRDVGQRISSAGPLATGRVCEWRAQSPEGKGGQRAIVGKADRLEAAAGAGVVVVRAAAPPAMVARSQGWMPKSHASRTG